MNISGVVAAAALVGLLSCGCAVAESGPEHAEDPASTRSADRPSASIPAPPATSDTPEPRFTREFRAKTRKCNAKTIRRLEARHGGQYACPGR